eukprot:903749-Amphidinium_carterae.2
MLCKGVDGGRWDSEHCQPCVERELTSQTRVVQFCRTVRNLTALHALVGPRTTSCAHALLAEKRTPRASSHDLTRHALRACIESQDKAKKQFNVQ